VSSPNKVQTDPFADSQFVANLGFEVIEASAGKALLSVNVGENLTNRYGTAHGGVTAALADMALGMAAQNPTGDWAHIVTITLTINFLAPGRGRLRAEGRLLKAGTSVAFCDGEICDEEGTMVAKATGTYKVARK
jgi:uncharacterized protein (TIGR00369 family)